MKRIQMVLAALAIVVTSLAAFSGPAMADDLDCRDAKGDLIRCDGVLYEPYNSGSYDDDYYYHQFYSPIYSPFAFPFYADYNYEDYGDDFEEYLEDNYNW